VSTSVDPSNYQSRMIAGVRLGQYNYDGDDPRVELWYQCESRHCQVYLLFEERPRSQKSETIRALEYACRESATGVSIRRMKSNKEEPSYRLSFHVIPFKPFQPRFNSNLDLVIDYEDLVIRPDRQLTKNVQVVTFENQLFVHKFMTADSEQCDFETEVERYQVLNGYGGVPEFRGVVRRDGLLQGILISYIDGDNLWTMVTEQMIKEDAELLDITYHIIEIAAKLEQRGVYHQDLKCQNIVRCRSSGDIYFIDFGTGMTDGMYLSKDGPRMRYHGVDAADAMYILGMTLWQLWTSDYPTEDAQLDRIRNLAARTLIDNCIKRRFQTIETLWRNIAEKDANGAKSIDGGIRASEE
jgi:predicted Ser/Thr protein kinase